MFRAMTIPFELIISALTSLAKLIYEIITSKKKD
jgi:hypothetical protein